MKILLQFHIQAAKILCVDGIVNARAVGLYKRMHFGEQLYFVTVGLAYKIPAGQFEIVEAMQINAWKCTNSRQMLISV